MARNYRKNTTRRGSNRKSSTSLGWVWLFLGILIGILGVMFLSSTFTRQWSWNAIKQLSTVTESNNASKRAAQGTHDKAVRAHPRAKKETNAQYEFYTLLPGMEVQLPDKPEQNVNANPPPPKPASPKTTVQVTESSVPKTGPHSNPNTKQKLATVPTTPKTTEPKVSTKMAAPHFIVQAGIFREPKLADELKARLTLQGFNTHIQRVRAQDGHHWFRVTLGPYKNEPIALMQKKRLAQHKVQAVLILQRPLQ